MKLIFAVLITLFSLNAFSQKVYLMEGGGTDTGTVTVQYAIAPLYIPYQSKDTGYLALKYNTVDFKLVQGGLALANNNISTSEWYGRIVATKNQKNFVFNSIPANYWDFMIFRNGVKIVPEVDYFRTGNFIYIPAATINNSIEYYRLR